MPHPKVKRMRERLWEVLSLALEAKDEREADRILYLYYEKGAITREEAIRRLKSLNGKRVA